MTNIINYTLHLADNALILSQRNSEWCGHGPILEQDIAITNISLDLLGQARNFYQYAALQINNLTNQQLNNLTTEDSLAYLRPEREFKNCLLVEQPNGDWAQTILRQYLFSNYQFLLYKQLQHSKDEQLAAIAAKALKEVTYHLHWSSEWVARLGNGTDESRNRMLKSMDNLWSYTGELFENAEYELHLMSEGVSIDVQSLKKEWLQNVNESFTEATLPVPTNIFMHTGGKKGIHTEHLGFILTALQYMQKTYPGCEW
jgi:ring-1,2-phenylacetyl-CoA epoxidase subunit PaaC